MDNLTPEKRSKIMANVKGRDTRPELAVRRYLHRNGFRFRVHDKRYSGRPDLILPKYAVAIFVHGCFWHGHNCSNFRAAKTRTEWWRAKIDLNRQRDQRVETTLHAAGWNVIIVWECELNDFRLESLVRSIREGRIRKDITAHR